MLKPQLLALLVLVMLAAGCVSLPGMKAAVSYGSLESVTEDLSVSGEVFPKEVTSDRSLDLVFNFVNQQGEIELKGITQTVYDRCLFSLKEGSADSWTFDLLPNHTAQKTANYQIGTVDFGRDCALRFITTYTGQARISQTVAALTMQEYDAQDIAGTLGETPLYYSSTTNPLSLAASFSPEQPFREGDTVYMYLDYSDVGSGFLDKLSTGDVEIMQPANLQLVSCDDYSASKGTAVLFRNCGGGEFAQSKYASGIAIDANGDGALESYEWRSTALVDKDIETLVKEGGGKLFDFTTPEGFKMALIQDAIYIQTDYSTTQGKYSYNAFFAGGSCDTSLEGKDPAKETSKESSFLTLNRNLTFINKAAKRSTCTFTAAPAVPLDTGALIITANYKYKLDNSILVKVKPR